MRKLKITKNKKLLSKRMRYILSMCVIVIGLLVCSLSLAYYTSRDVVTNKHVSKAVRISLIEENWDDHGSADAEIMQPGMIIDKDPVVQNDSDDTVYVRLNLSITDSSDEDISSDSEKYKAILSSLYCKNNSGDDYAFLNWSESSEISIDSCNNNDFFYDNDYFYYKTPLEKNEKTSTLFDYISIPVLKSEYQYFDEKFSINVTAQGISSSAVDLTDSEDESATEKAIISAFNSKYGRKQ